MLCPKCLQENKEIPMHRGIEVTEIVVDAYKDEKKRMIPEQTLTLWNMTCSEGHRYFKLQPPIISYLSEMHKYSPHAEF